MSIRVRNIHISTKLQFKGKPLPVDHGEGEIIQWHLAISNKDIPISVPAEFCKRIRMYSINIAFDTGVGFSHYGTSASIKFRENTINRYFIQEENLVGDVAEAKENYDLLTAVIICLGHSGDDKYAGILKLLDVLLSSETEPDEKKKILQDDFHIKMTKALESEVQTMCNLSKGVEEKGIAIGIEREREAGTLRSIQNLMETLKLTAEQAMAALKVPDSEQERYASMIKKQ